MSEFRTDTKEVSADRLSQFIERVERLEEDRQALSSDIRDVLAQARGEGYDVKTLRQIVRLRKMDRDERQEADALLDLYRSTLGL